jgi:hypothetical protein
MEAQIPDVDGAINFSTQFQEQLPSVAGLVQEGGFSGTSGQNAARYYMAC